jgi:hypothetical protein
VVRKVLQPLPQAHLEVQAHHSLEAVLLLEHKLLLALVALKSRVVTLERTN